MVATKTRRRLANYVVGCALVFFVCCAFRLVEEGKLIVDIKSSIKSNAITYGEVVTNSSSLVSTIVELM